MSKTIKVAHVISKFKLVLNIGTDDGYKAGDRFLIYQLSDFDIEDPDTHQSLGKLELVRGRGVITHIQRNICQITSDRYSTNQPKKIIKRTRTSLGMFNNEPEYEEIDPPSTLLPFDGARVGDMARPI